MVSKTPYSRKWSRLCIFDRRCYYSMQYYLARRNICRALWKARGKKVSCGAIASTRPDLHPSLKTAVPCMVCTMDRMVQPDSQVTFRSSSGLPLASSSVHPRVSPKYRNTQRHGSTATIRALVYIICTMTVRTSNVDRSVFLALICHMHSCPSTQLQTADSLV